MKRKVNEAKNSKVRKKSWPTCMKIRGTKENP